MKNKQVFKRLLSGVLAVAVAASAVIIPASAEDGTRLSLKEVSSEGFSVRPTGDKIEETENNEYADTDEVRVSIFLDDPSTINAGFDIDTIATNSKAIAYRNTLKAKQETIEEKIETATSEKLDVVHNLTLAANVISANVKYGQIKDIEKISGVNAVVIENQYEAARSVEDLPNDPNMSTSTNQIGSNVAWADGYTGAGSKIAVIDTGIDTEHMSFDGDAYLYSLKELAEEKGLDLDAYMASLNLLDEAAIEAVKDQLNASINVEDVSVSAKIPFAYNYVDEDYDVTHENDSQGEHGSHVEGIAAANKYVKIDGEYVPAISSVLVQGVAPDAQIITMKVFGKGGGAYDSDYMLAIEDAIVLGADAINLSLGSSSAGDSKSTTTEYQQIMEDLSKCGAVVSISAGNAGHWADSAYTGGYLYADDVSTQTNGSPGSFTNAFTVASADNVGMTGEFFTIGDSPVIYTQSEGYGNALFSTLAGEQEYLYLDYIVDEDGTASGIGTEEEWAAVAEALQGKIAVCSRGTTSFYEKANLAVKYGAIGVIIYNNTAGSISMDLSGYTYDKPVISVTQAEGALFKENGTVSGDKAYYTGTITVNEGIGSAIVNNGFSTVSDFSSWGVPGSLELKPEITAPGGNIYSVNGLNYAGGGHDQYENMSGTSMAAPQVAGMSALAAQYIRENGLEEQTGLKARTLAQSLLMSTAEPMFEDLGEYGVYYYPVIRQGAGLANIGNVVKAESYILMDDDANAGAADGKVKVELGDDPDKSGVYTFGFTIYNLTDDDKSYTLSADMFAQYIFADSYGDLYMDTATEYLSSTAEFDCGDVVGVPANGSAHVTATITLTDDDKEYLDLFDNGTYVEGYVYASPYKRYYDFNGDGKVNEADGQRLLDYCTGVSTKLYDEEHADLDEDGDIDTHDAYEFLNRLGKGELQVTEGEGIEGTTHSIPVFGFYGDWSSASMFDKGSYVDYELAGTEDRIPYLAAQTGYDSLDVNAFGVTYGDDGPYYLGGNLMVSDETYHPERVAVNNTNGTVLSMISFAPIRNAVDSKFTVYNETTGETLVNKSVGSVTAAYVNTNTGAWLNYALSYKPNYNFSGAEDGDVLNISFALAPEYYQDADGNVRWEDMDLTNALSATVTIDNTAPAIDQAIVKGNTLSVYAKDNQYISAIALVNKGGTNIYAYCGAPEVQTPGEITKFELDVEGINADQLYLQVYDYALNVTTYAIPDVFGDGTVVPSAIAFDAANGNWVSYDRETDTIEEIEGSNYSFTAATVVDHIVYAADENGVLFTMPEKDLSDTTRVISLSNQFGQDITVYDMAYDSTTGTLYALVNGNYLAPIDLLTGEVLELYRTPFTTTTLAIDDEGSFYSNRYATGNIYSYTLDTDPVLVGQLDEGSSIAALQAMEYDAASETIGWTWVDSFWGIIPITTYVEIDLNAESTDEAVTVYESQYFYQLTSLIFPDKTTESTTPAWAAPTNEVTGVLIDVPSPYVTMIKGGTLQLSADVLPWTATNKAVAWESTNTDVATVSADGKVTAVSEGVTYILAESKADSDVYDVIQVTVDTLDITLDGVLQDEDGNPLLFTWDMSKDDTWRKTFDLGTSVESITVNTNTGNGYLMDASSFDMHEINLKDGSTIAHGSGIGLPYVDTAYSDMFSTEDTAAIVGLYGSWVLLEDDAMNLQAGGYNLASYLANNTGASFFTAIANMGTIQTYDDDLGVLDVELYAVLDNLNYLWIMGAFDYSGMSLYGWFDIVDTGIDEDYNGMSDYDLTASMVMGDDGVLYLSAFNTEDNRNNLYRIILEDGNDGFVCSSDFIGCTEDNVWPLALTSVTTNANAANSNETVSEVTGSNSLRQSVQLPTADNAFKLISFEKSIDSFDRAEAQKAEAEEIAEFAAKSTLVHAAEDVATEPTKEGNGDTSADIDGDKLTVTIIPKDENGNNVDTTNGLFRVFYDSEKLDLVSVDVNADYESVNDATTGKLVIGYVNPEEALAAGEKAVDLVFTVKEGAELDEDSIVVDHAEVIDTNYNEVGEDGTVIDGKFLEEKPLAEEEEEEPTPVETDPVETDPADTTPSDGDENQPTGIVIAFVPAVVSAAAVMVAKKRNKRK